MFLRKNFRLIAVIALAVLCFPSIRLEAYIFGNGSGGAYNGGDSDSESLIQRNEIEVTVEKAASYFLIAQKHLYEVLFMYEQKDSCEVDYAALKSATDCSLANIQKAKDTYAYLIGLAETKSYNWYFIFGLYTFDYYSFRICNNLNPSLFYEIQKYLSAGDILGFYRQINVKLHNIEGLLTGIANDVNAKKLPKLATLWRLHEMCSEVAITGSYASRVFYEVLKTE